MLADTPPMDGESGSEAGSKRNGKRRLLRLADLDGRTRSRKAADWMLRELLSDLGGEDRVSAGKRALAEHAAVLNAIAQGQGARYLAGEPIDVAEYATLTNALRRLLSDLGLQSQPTGSSLRDQVLAERHPG